MSLCRRLNCANRSINSLTPTSSLYTCMHTTRHSSSSSRMSFNSNGRTPSLHDPSTGSPRECQLTLPSVWLTARISSSADRFHTVALAVSAAHRFAAPSKSPDIESTAASAAPLSPNSRRSGLQLRRKTLNRSPERYHWVSAGPSGGGIGDEPGVDVRSRRDELAYGPLKGSATITVGPTFLCFYLD